MRETKLLWILGGLVQIHPLLRSVGQLLAASSSFLLMLVCMPKSAMGSCYNQGAFLTPHTKGCRILHRTVSGPQHAPDGYQGLIT